MAESIDPGVVDARIEDWEMVNGFSNSDDSKEKIERLKEVFTENSDMKRLMKVKEAQLNDLQARIGDKERELENKYKEIEERDREIEYWKERVEKQNAELKKTKTLEELKEMKELLSERIISLTQDKVDLSLEVSDLKYKIFELTQQLSEAKTKLSQVVDERDRLANKQPKKRKETKNRAALEEPEDEEKQILITQVNAYSRECDKLKGQLQTAREESNKKVSELTKEIQSLTHEKRHTREREAEQLTMKLDEMRMELDRMQTEKAKTLDQNNLMREANKALLMKNKNLQSECDTLWSKCDTLQSECDTLQSECDTLQSECHKLTELQAETGKLRTENIELQSKCNTLNEVIDKIAASNKSSAPTSPSVEEKHLYYTPHQLEPVQDTNNEKEGRGEGDGSVAIVPLSVLPAKKMVLPLGKKREKDKHKQLLEEEALKEERDIDRVLREVDETRRGFAEAMQREQLQEQRNISSPFPIGTIDEVPKGWARNTDSAPVVPPMSTSYESDDIPENRLINGIDTEIQYYANEVRNMSRKPKTTEVIREIEGDDRPYDPNLVCPRCGRQYRVGEIQKLKRHINEFCVGKR